MSISAERRAGGAVLTREMQKVVDGMARLRAPRLDTLTPAQARASYEAAADVLEIDRPAMARVTDLIVTARDGALLPARLYLPHSASGDVPGDAPSEGLGEEAPLWPVLLYLHGGGFTIGSIGTHDILCRSLALQGRCAVLSLGYRLAPEHRFPVAVEDTWDALLWLRASAPALGLDPSRIAIGGDSAGGTLATVCATLARDAGLPLALQLLIYPGCASYPHSDSYRRFREGFVLDAAMVDWFFAHYLRTPDDRLDWRFAPLHTPDLEGVSPAWVCLAECDPVTDEGLAYADRLRLAGVPVDLEIYRGVTHEFIKMGRAVPEGRRAQAAAGRALRNAFGTDD